jgi:hypothetical protein
MAEIGTLRMRALVRVDLEVDLGRVRREGREDAGEVRVLARPSHEFPGGREHAVDVLAGALLELELEAARNCPRPRTGGGGIAMMKASSIAAGAEELPMILSAVCPLAMRSSKGRKRRRSPRIEAFVKVAPEKPRTPPHPAPGRSPHDPGALHTRVGARQAETVGQLHDHDGVALVEGGDEAARHRVATTPCRSSPT